MPLTPCRIPLGYWSIPLTPKDTRLSTDVSPYISGAWPYFVQALTWAKSYSFNVIVDIHGAPGSQNGYDNSGQRISSPMWANNQSYVQKTIDCVTFLVKNVGDKIDILEVMNEPAGFLGDGFTNVLKQYYVDSYNAIRAAVGNGTGVMFSDGFHGLDVSTLTKCVFELPLRHSNTVLGGLLQSSSVQININGHRMRLVSSLLHLSLTVTPKSICIRSSAIMNFPVPSTNTSPTHAA